MKLLQVPRGKGLHKFVFICAWKIRGAIGFSGRVDVEICWQRIRGIVARRYADTSSRNHFRLSEKPSVIKMTPTINL